MTKRIKFSIIIPAYKGKFLFECIESVLTQTYANFEVIVVDDHSPENLQSIINKFDDKRLQYYRNEIGFGAINVVGNWNKCLEYASGDFLICMGDDDKLTPNCLSDYLELINNFPELDLYHTRTVIIDEESRVINIQEPRPLRESVFSLLYFRIKGRMQFIGDFMFRLSTLKEHGGFYSLPTGCCSDDISACIAAASNGVANTQTIGFQYRDNGLTLSRCGTNMLAKTQAFDIAKEWYLEFLEKECADGELDTLYKKMIISNLDNYINSHITHCCRVDINNRGVDAFRFWNSVRLKYNISFRFLVKNLISCRFK